MSQSPQFAQDYVIDIPQEPGRIPRQRIEEFESIYFHNNIK